MRHDESAVDIAAARKLFAGACDFFWGTGDIDSLPPQSLPEIAFVGRSNVGKSSLINALTNRKTLARVSHTPGRTREINFFNLSERLILTDLPGYGTQNVWRAAGDATFTLGNLGVWGELTHQDGRTVTSFPIAGAAATIANLAMLADDVERIGAAVCPAPLGARRAAGSAATLAWLHDRAHSPGHPRWAARR